MINYHKKIVFHPPVILVVGIHLLIIMCFYYWAHKNWNNLCTYGYESLIFPWVVVSFFTNLFTLKMIGKADYADFGLVFMICSYLFMFGHTFISVFDLQTTLLWNPSPYFSSSEKFRSALYAIGCLLVFSLIYACVINQKKNVNKFFNNNSNLDSRWIYKLGWIFLVIGFISSVLTWGKIIVVTLSSGSYASYTLANTTGFFDDLSYLFAPGIIYLFSSHELNKKNERTLLVISLLFLTITMILSGARKTQLFAIIAIVLCYSSTRNKSKTSIRSIFMVLISGLVLLDLIYVIRENRFELNTIGSTFLNSLKGFKFLSSIVGETFAESGLSFYALVAVVSNVPSVFPYEYGMTFIRTIPSFLPIGWLVGDFFDKAASSYVINRFTGLPVGTSLLGDFYWNFGFAGGTILCAIFAIILAKISLLRIESHKEYQYFSYLYIVLMGVRAGIFEIFRPLSIVLLVPLIVELILRGRLSLK